MKGNKVAITVRELCENPPHSKVSIRTDGCVYANTICQRFGGGGHKMAAGCELDLPPQETVEKILAAVDELWV